MSKWWLEQPWRMVQTNLREMDFRDMDAQQFAQDAVDLHATVVMLSTSGIVGNYPTKLAYHHRNPYASDTILMEMINACHARGLRVIGRMDFSKVREPMSSQHPEWAFVGEKGERVCYNGDTHVCCNSEYQRRLSLNILRETLEMLPLDGVFFNFGGYTSGYDYSGNLYGDCVCPNCRARFEQMYGQELPNPPSQSPLYEEFKQRTLAQAQREVRKLIAEVRPDICIANDLFGAEGFYRAEAGSGLAHGDWLYSASDLASRARSGYPSMRASITTVDFIDIAYRYASPSPHRQQLRLAQSMAHGGSPDLYVMGRLDNRDDRSGVAAAREMFAWHEAHQGLYDRMRSLAEILLVRPETHWLLGGDAAREYRGWFDMLAQAHYLFDSVDESRLSHMDLSRYRAVLLPAARLSSESERVLEAYLAAGGRALFTLCGEQPPACTGVERIDEMIRDSRGMYAYQGEADALPRTAELGAQVLPIIGGYACCAFHPDVRRCQRVILPHPYGPPERCYYTQISEEPAYTVCNSGAGRCTWIPWKPGVSFAAGRQRALALWMQDVLESALALHPVDTDAPACVEITLAQSGDGSCVLHLVNASGDVGGVWHKPLPLGRIRVHLKTEKPACVKDIAGVPCEWRWQDGVLSVEAELNGVLTAVQMIG